MHARKFILMCVQLHKSATEKRIEELERKLNDVTTYNEYIATCKELDIVEGMQMSEVPR